MSSLEKWRHYQSQRILLLGAHICQYLINSTQGLEIKEKIELGGLPSRSDFGIEL